MVTQCGIVLILYVAPLTSDKGGQGRLERSGVRGTDPFNCRLVVWSHSEGCLNVSNFLSLRVGEDKKGAASFSKRSPT